MSRKQQIADVIAVNADKIEQMNSFFGINLASAPFYRVYVDHRCMGDSDSGGPYTVVFCEDDEQYADD